eukprot:Pgem_evm1s6994
MDLNKCVGIIQNNMLANKIDRAVSFFQDMKHQRVSLNEVLYEVVIDGCLNNSSIPLALQYCKEALRYGLRPNIKVLT